MYFLWFESGFGSPVEACDHRGFETRHRRLDSQALTSVKGALIDEACPQNLVSSVRWPTYERDGLD